ncbi:TRAP transporter substrate-binding protein [Marinomonas algicola]|uniref:TRAP transporter substrate-binding protein n=1 Tax=Marinomonas algicola TaxID=2773454 RepID=UPI00174E6B70|nr:TRAP transporter substrate-binding protein [Marinomonas algicola]
MIKRNFATLFTASLITTGISLSNIAVAENFIMSSWVPPTHPLVKDVLAPWTKDIKKATDGRVNIRILPKSIGSPPQQFEVVESKQADIVYGNQSYTAGVFNDYAFVELPFGGDNPIATSVAYWRTYDRYLKANDEMGSVKVLSLFTHGPGQLFTKGVEFTDISDKNADAKIRAGGVSSANAVSILKATPIQAPLSSAAEMLTNGVVNGIALDPMSLSILHFDKYVDRRFEIEGGFYNVSFFVAMNKDSWNKISKDDQKIIDQLSGEHLARKAGEMWLRGGDNSTEFYAEKGIKTYQPTGQFKEQLQQLLSVHEKEWVEKSTQKGLPAQEVLDYYRSEVSALSQ